MAETDPTPGNYEEKTSGKAISAIRKWNSCLLDKSNSDSNTEEDKDYVAVKRQLSVNLSLTLRTRQLLIDSDGGRPVLSLRAPLDLVNFPSMSRPRWPVECEVISDAVHHIEWEPPHPEPFYLSTGLERRPTPTGEERRKVVYCIGDANKCPYFTYSRPGGSRGPIKSATVCNFSQTDTLEFESRFESGNLQKAVRVGICDYELTLRTDLYTTKHTQWFYFRVRNMRAGVSYRFTIVNFMKCSSLYSQGMRPLLYSERVAEIKGIGWQRAGSNISYYRNQDSSSDAPVLYSLTWTLYFPYGSDTCYLAHCYPYTYSRLQRYLRGVSSNPAVMSYCKLRVLCHTLAGNAVYVMTITSRGAARSGSRAKKAVVVTARVHPGETNGSWMMEGLLDFLLGDSDDAQLLRDTFVFKVVPMLNPDGVVVGNYRCSLAGRDLNRNYNTLLRDSFPCVWHTRNMVERVMADTDVVLYCDFHGHNRKNNVFMYGCNSRGDVSLHERVFPLMMSKNTSNKFSFKSCKFRVQKSKEGTGRIAMYRLGIRNSYTMEATFAGSTLGDRKGTHFTTGDLKSLGFYLCDTLLDYCDPDPVKTSFCLTELATSLRKHLGTDCKFISDLESSTSGSNSSDSDGLPAHLLNRSQTVHPEAPSVTKKKKRLSRKKRNLLREERAKTTKLSQGSNKHVESYQRHESTVIATPQDKPAGRHRKKWQLSSPVMKSRIPPATSQHGEISQVTLWQGCEPVKDNYRESARAPQLHCREQGCPHLSTGTSTLPHTGMDTRQWRCSSQLLHLSALLPPPQSLFHPTERLHLYRRQSVVSYKVVRGRLPSLAVSQRSPSFMFIKMIPDSAPAKRLLASSTTDRPNSRRVYQSRNSLRVSEHYFVPEGPSDTCTDVIKTKPYREELRKGVALSLCRPLRDQHQRNIFLKGPDPQHDLFVLRDPYPQGQRLCKGASEDTWRSSVLPRLTETHGFTKEALPPRHKDAKHFKERP